MPPIRPVEPVPPYDPGPMPPHTSPFALFGVGAAAGGLVAIQVLPLLLLTRYLALVGVVCGLVAFLLGLLALWQIARFPKRVEGRRMAFAAMAVGLLEVLGYTAFFVLRGGS